MAPSVDRGAGSTGMKRGRVRSDGRNVVIWKDLAANNRTRDDE
jgi:hypothetical protein